MKVLTFGHWLFATFSIVKSQQETLSLDISSTENKNITRIVGGQVAAVGQWPWQVAVGRSLSHRRHTFVCGGSLIGERAVLTAAHCLDRDDITEIMLLFAVYDVANPGITTQYRYTSNFLNHPEYNSKTYWADISIIKFEKGLTFNELISPVALPSEDTPLSADQSCVVSGFGDTTVTEGNYVLNYAEVPTISLETCNEWYSSVRVTVPIDHICAGYEGGGIDSCQGDSGGPLVCLSSGTYILEGVTSFGVGCADPRKPGAYTSVRSYRDWINENSKNSAFLRNRFTSWHMTFFSLQFLVWRI